MIDRLNLSGAQYHYVPMCSFDETLINGVDLSVQAVIGFDQDPETRPMKYSTEGSLLYCCGPHLVMFDTLTSKFMCQARLDPASKVSFMKILNEETEEGWSIIGECWTDKSPQVLVQREGEIICLFHRHLPVGERLKSASLSSDKRLLYTLASGKLSLWNISMKKLISYIDISPKITHIETDPRDSLMCVLGGYDYLKVWRVSPERKAIEEDPYVLCSHPLEVVDMSYVPSSESAFLLLSGTRELMVFFNWQMTSKYTLAYAPTGFHCTARDCVVATRTSLELFLLDKEKDLKYVRSIEVPTSGSITSATMSYHEDQAVVLIQEESNLIPYLTDLTEGTSKPAFGTRLHYGGIAFMSASRAKDLLLTVGIDKKVKIWNIFDNWKCINEEDLDEMPNSVGFHPSGFQFAIGLEGSCKVFYLLYESFSLAHTNPKRCSALAYSQDGKYLAFASNNSVLIYCPYKLFHLCSISLQNPSVSIVWNESIITSTTAQGTIHVHEIENSISTSIDLEVFTHSAVQAFYDKSLDLLACVCKDKRFRVFGDAGLTLVYVSKEDNCLNVSLSKELEVVFLGTTEGTIRVMLWPIIEVRSEESGVIHEAEWMEWKIHTGPVRSIEITGGLMNIFTGSDDSSIVCLKPKLIKNGKEKPLVSRHYTTEYNGLSLVPQSYIELQSEELTQLQDSIKNLESDHFKLDKVQKEYEAELQQFNLSSVKELEAVKAEKEKVRQKIEEVKSTREAEKQEIERAHQARLNSQNDRFTRVLSEESEKYEKLKEVIIATREKLIKQRDDLLLSHADIIEGIQKDYDEKLSQARTAYDQLEVEYENTKKKYQVMINYADTDFKEFIEEKLFEKTEDVNKQKLKAKHFLRKQTQLARDSKNIQDEIQELKEKSQTFKEQNDALTQEISSIQEKLAELVKEMEKKEDVIKKRETNIKELRSLHSHLQNYRFVLDQKIKSLKEERGPMEYKGDSLQKHIKQLFGELLEEHNIQTTHSTTLGGLRQKNKEVLTTSQALRNKLLVANRKLEQLFSDLQQLFTVQDNESLLYKLRDLYYKHVGREDLDTSEKPMTSINDLFIKERQENTKKVRGETQQQVRFMQNTLSKVKSNKNIIELEQSKQLHKKHEENANLIKECNKLRQEKEQLIKQKLDLEAAIKRLRFSQSRFGATEAQVKSSMPTLTPFQEYHATGTVSHNEIWRKRERVDPRIKQLIQQLEKNRSDYNRQTQKLNQLVAREMITPSTALVSTLSYQGNQAGSLFSQK